MTFKQHKLILSILPNDTDHYIKSWHALKPKDNFAGVDCVTIDSQIQESQFDDSRTMCTSGLTATKARKRTSATSQLT